METLITKIKEELHYWGLYNKCPDCGSKLFKSYNYDHCSSKDCNFGKIIQIKGGKKHEKQNINGFKHSIYS